MVVASTLANAQADNQSTALLQTALKALGAGALEDVTVTATAQRSVGPSSQTVQATFKAVTSGSTQLSYQTSPGALVETRVSTNGIWAGNWTDSQGTTHPLAYHNMLTEPDWFFPILTIVRGLNATASTGLTLSYIGAETFNGAAVQHLRLNTAAGVAAHVAALGQSELYLDAVTLLPVGITYNDHPDNSVLIDIPVTVTFANYSLLSGLIVPTHVQQFRNNALSLDLQIQSITLNTGVTITLPQAAE